MDMQYAFQSVRIIDLLWEKNTTEWLTYFQTNRLNGHDNHIKHYKSNHLYKQGRTL